VRRAADRGCERDFPGRAERTLNQAHGIDDATPLGRREALQHGRHLASRQPLQRRKRGPSASGQDQMRLTAVGLRCRTGDESAPREALEDSAQISAVEL